MAALLISMLALPALAHLVLRRPAKGKAAGASTAGPKRSRLAAISLPIIVLAVALLLTRSWLPLGPEHHFVVNFLFVVVTIGALLLAFFAFQRVYVPLLRWSLKHKVLALTLPVAVLIGGVASWSTLGREFMPPFDEGSFMYMPTTMPHASFGQALEMLHTMDAAIQEIPEIDRAVGKLGRAESPLDPAPISMFETVVTYKPEFSVDADGNRVRNWRDHIRSPKDIWEEIIKAAQAPGLTSAPMLMPINTRIIMLQSGMRADLELGARPEGIDDGRKERLFSDWMESQLDARGLAKTESKEAVESAPTTEAITPPSPRIRIPLPEPEPFPGNFRVIPRD